MNKKAILVFAISGFFNFAIADNLISCPENQPLLTQESAEQLLNKWSNNLIKYNHESTKNTEISAATFTALGYDKDAILLPTVNPITRSDSQQIYDYFEDFLEKNPIMLLPENPHLTTSRCGYGMINGYYNFKIYPKTHKETMVGARYTIAFLYHDKTETISIAIESNDKVQTIKNFTQPVGWYIVTQHSSVLPEKSSNHKKVKKSNIDW